MLASRQSCPWFLNSKKSGILFLNILDGNFIFYLLGLPILNLRNSFSTWSLLNHDLPLGFRLKYLGVLNPRYHFCNESKSCMHLFQTCRYFRVVWEWVAFFFFSLTCLFPFLGNMIYKEILSHSPFPYGKCGRFSKSSYFFIYGDYLKKCRTFHGFFSC